MTRHVDLDRALEEWLTDGPSELPDRTLEAIVRQLDDRRQRRPRGLPGRGSMNRPFLMFGGIAAAVAVALLAGAMFLGLGANRSGLGAPAPTASPTPAPTATAAAAALPVGVNVPLEPGRYYAEVHGYRFTIGVPAAGFVVRDTSGETIYQGSEKNSPADFAAISFWGDPKTVAKDPCHWRAAGTVSTGRTAADFARAVAGVAALGASEIVDVQVGRYSGKGLRVTVPMNTDLASCDDSQFRSFEDRYYQGPGQVDEISILDVDGGGRQLVFISYLPNTPDHVKAELRLMVETMEVEPIRK